MTERDQEAVIGGDDGVQVVRIPRRFLGASLTKALGGLVKRDIILMIQGAPRVEDLIGSDVDLVELAVEHVLARLAADRRQIILGNVVGTDEEGITGSHMAFMKIDIGFPGLAVRGDKVVLKSHGVNLLVGIIQDMDGSVAEAQIRHITSPEGDHIAAKEPLRPEVGRHLVGALVHQIAIVVVDEGSSTSLLVSSRTDEDVSGINLTGLGDLQLGRCPGAGVEGAVRPGVGSDPQRQQQRAAGGEGAGYHFQATV